MIVSIQYNSPGSIDIFGVGKVCDVLAKIIGRSVVFFAERGLRREQTEQARLETKRMEIELEREQESVRALKLANARTLLELKRDFRDGSEGLLLLLAVNDQDKILPKIAEGKLVGAKSLEDKPPKGDEAA